MTLTLLAAAGAVLLWPDDRARSRRRLRATAPEARAPAGARLPVPLLAAVGAGAVAAVLSTPLVAVLAAGCGALAARGRAVRAAAAAEEARLAVLADVLGALGAELRAGNPLDDAVRAAAAGCPDRECGDAVVRAVRVAYADAPGGGPAGSAGARSRTPTAELAGLAAAVALSARTGCSLATVLAAVEDDLRARLRLRRALLVATAGPRSSARVLAGLPVLGLAMGSGVGADPWQVLTSTGPGQVLLVVGVLLEVAGIAWTGRLVRRIVP